MSVERDEREDGMTVAQLMESLRSKVAPAIAQELRPVIDSADDRELAGRLAIEASIAAARAVEPALKRLEGYLMALLHMASKLKEAEAIIESLQLRASGAKPN